MGSHRCELINCQHRSGIGQTSPSERDRHTLYCNLDRVDYTLSPDELKRLESAGTNVWKDAFLVCVAVGIPCLVNAAPVLSASSLQVTLPLFLNSLFAITGLFVGAPTFGILWWKTGRTFQEVVDGIKAKPPVEIGWPGDGSYGVLAMGSLEFGASHSDSESEED